MIEKMNIFDVEIPILTAKEAMIRAMQYLESESVDTIELVSMDMLMKERENAQWKEQIKAQPGNRRYRADGDFGE